RGRLFLGIGGRDHFGIRGRIASEFAGNTREGGWRDRKRYSPGGVKALEQRCEIRLLSCFDRVSSHRRMRRSVDELGDHPWLDHRRKFLRVPVRQANAPV
ncbi:hypothetical protein GOA59_28570, partial [Sinorhizobium meliloti]|nr:hypothetical protein [Sinorhizobium meliloti]MDW9608791.1 hypothetical protein [Sinorhizobium meliloti]MDW9676664.1 hypothetical protein [Sinorhizobium meliloti]MDW9955481.1 hypothetical protein [Sinorhizobium meliloti]MDX0390291.1 hypothetical protein [Sinorhizobium meliloti]